MKWSMLKVVACTMTRRIKLSEWLLVAVLLLAACQPVRLEPTKAVDAMRQPEAGSIYTTLGCLAKPDERIVTGDPTKVREGLESFYARYHSDIEYRNRFGKDANVALPNLRPVDQVDLTLAAHHEIAPAYGNDKSGKQAAFLYRGKDVDLLDTIFLADNAISEENRVTVAPNFYLFAVDGAGGGGQSAGGNPFSISSVEAKQATYSDFQNQWALAEIKATSMYNNYQQSGGEGVVVAIFDTSPFQYVEQELPFAATETLTAKEVAGQSARLPAMTLTNHYAPVASPSMDHGVFVAGLVQAVAPQAEIHLYRAFNDSGGTDSFALVNQLNQFAEDFLEPSTNGTQASAPKRLVVNLSFSFSCSFGPNFNYAQFEAQVAHVSQAIDRLIDAGVIVVASAGNIPFNPTSTVATQEVKQHYPASHERIIGVGALDSTMNPACFTNNADFFAPGGGAVFASSINDDGGNACLQDYTYCAELSDCPDALMSYSTASESGLAYWNGASFAAPLVTGLVALMLGDPAPGETPMPVSFERVEAELANNTFEINRSSP